MRNLPIIQRLTALVLVLLFTFSITPRQFLHDLFADHTDFYTSCHGTEATISNSGKNCKCDDLVVSVPFLGLDTAEEVASLSEHGFYNQVSYQFYFSSTFSTPDLRGPPQTI